MPGASEKYLRYAVSLAFAGLTVFLGYFVKRTDFLPFITAYGSFFGLYAWLLLFRGGNITGRHSLVYLAGNSAAGAARFQHSEFVRRFLPLFMGWQVDCRGYHPFTHPPVYFIQNHIFPAGITPELFSRLNSPEYFTVYPPLCQAVFALAALVSPTSERGGVVVMKLLLLACEAGTVLQLAGGSSSWQRGSGFDRRMGVLYALNPLAILEIVGNCHFEGAMIFFMVAGLRALERRKTGTAAFCWSLATAVKLLPLMFLPILLRWSGRQKAPVFLNIFSGISCSFRAAAECAAEYRFQPRPVFQAVSIQRQRLLFAGSNRILDKRLRHRRNARPLAGSGNVCRCAGDRVEGPPRPRPLPVGGDASFDAVRVETPLPSGEGSGVGWTHALLLALMLQLGLSATVHPWYVTVPLALGILAGRRFPVWWSGLVALSYSHYAGGGFQENYGLIALEYGVLWWLIISEIRKYGWK